MAVNRDFDRVGAKHNAQTSEEDTFYHVTCLPEYLPQAFDVLSDILRPTLRGDDFETEKQVIIEEIRMYLDNPMSVAYEAAKAAHFGSHPLGNSILGTVESITGLQADQMREYFARRYSPSNIVLAFAGKADWGSLVELANSHCGAWQEGTAASRVTVPVRGTGSFQAILRADDQQQTVVAVCNGPPLESPDRYAAHLLATILGDHTGSRLYWTLIDPGLADGAELSYQDYNQAGAFFSFLSCEPSSTQANLDRIAERLPHAMAQRRDRRRAGPGQEQGPRAVGAPKRTPDGPARVPRVPLDVPARLHLRRTRARGIQQGHVADLRRLLADWPLWPLTIVSVGPTTDSRAAGIDRQRPIRIPRRVVGPGRRNTPVQATKSDLRHFENRNRPGRSDRPGSVTKSRRTADTVIKSADYPFAVHSPLRSSASTLMPFFSPSDLTTSSFVGTSMLRRGGMAMPDSTLGISSSLLAGPDQCQPIEDEWRGVLDPNLVDQLALFSLGGAFDHLSANQAVEDPFGQGIGELHRSSLPFS